MDYREVLPQNTILDGKYRIDRVLGAGGFGITYEAVDVGLDMPVAIKEYYPTEFALRDQTRTVRPRSERHKQLFDHLRSSFLREAQTLAQFDDPAIVRVLSVFRANGTAYMVMRYEVGPSMKAWLAQLGRAPTQRELDTVLMSLLSALSVMHKRDFLHRDIATDNIILRADGSPVLLDFGSSRRVVAEATGTLTGIVKQGFSPPEQYSADSKVQGPWTDIYALGATLYRAIAGTMPPEATARTLDDQFVPSREAAKGAYRPEFLDAIDWSLAVMPKQRPQTVAAWRTALFAGTGFEQAQFTGPSHPISSEYVGDGIEHSDRVSSRPSARPSAPRVSGNSRPSTSSRPSLEIGSKSQPAITAASTPLESAPRSEPAIESAASQANWKRFIPVAGAVSILLLVGSMMLFAVPRQPGSSNAAPSQAGGQGTISTAGGNAVQLPGNSATVALAEPAKRLIDEQQRQREANEQRLREQAEQSRRATEETERLRVAALEQTRRQAADEAERLRIAEEARQRAAAAEAERQRLAEEARRRAADDLERNRIDAENRQRAAAEEAERTRLSDEQRQRAAAEAAERQRIAEEARQRAAAEEAERQRVAAEVRRRALVLNASQTLEFGRQIQLKLVEHNCFAGAVTGREADTRIGLDMLQRHQSDVPALKLVRTTMGESEDFLKWLDGLNKPICPPGPALEEMQRRNEEAARQKELDEQRARARQEEKGRQDADQAREREEERQRKAEQRRAQQQREAAAERERERSQQRRHQSSGGGSGGSGRSSSGGGGSPSIRIPSF